MDIGGEGKGHFLQKYSLHPKTQIFWGNLLKLCFNLISKQKLQAIDHVNIKKYWLHHAKNIIKYKNKQIPALSLLETNRNSRNQCLHKSLIHVIEVSFPSNHLKLSNTFLTASSFSAEILLSVTKLSRLNTF